MIDDVSFAQIGLALVGSLVSAAGAVGGAIWFTASERQLVRSKVESIEKRLSDGDVRMLELERGLAEERNSQAKIAGAIEAIRTDIDWIKHWLRDRSDSPK